MSRSRAALVATLPFLLTLALVLPAGPSGSSHLSPTCITHAVGGTTYFIDDMETGAPGWVTTDMSVTPNPWRLENGAPPQPSGPDANSGNHYWYTGSLPTPGNKYEALAEATLTSPPITIPAWAITPQLSVCIAGGSELGFDILDIMVEDLTLMTNTIVSSHSGAPSPLSPVNYQHVTANLMPYTGNTIKIHFIFTSDIIIEEGPGWNVDDVVVHDGGSLVAGCQNTGTGAVHYFDNMDVGAPGWAAVDFTAPPGNPWRLMDETIQPQPQGPDSNSGNFYWYVGSPLWSGTGYAPLAHAELTSPLINLGPATQPQLSICLAGASENGFDTLQLIVDDLTAMTSTTYLTVSGAPSPPVPPSTYQLHAFNLAPHAGNMIQLRFVFQSDLTLEHGPGWNLDDVVIREP